MKIREDPGGQRIATPINEGGQGAARGWGGALYTEMGKSEDISHKKIRKINMD